jgi:hypothetical protein
VEETAAATEEVLAVPGEAAVPLEEVPSLVPLVPLALATLFAGRSGRKESNGFF